MTHLTHLDKNGNINMVDVSQKQPSRREAVAKSQIRLSPKTMQRLMSDSIAKGNVLETAKIAGIMASKKTWDLIPLCHPVRITKITIDLETDTVNSLVLIKCTAVAVDRTGIEIEALTGASVAALTIYDMCKAYDKNMVIGETFLVSKTGGESGDFFREDEFEEKIR